MSDLPAAAKALGLTPLNMRVATAERPIYRKVPEHRDGETQFWIIVCDEGWREQIVCSGMYEWAADWLLGMLDDRPYAALTVRA